MPRAIAACLTAFALSAAVLTGCSNSGEGGREIVFSQTDDGCSPDTVAVTPGEKLKLTGENATGSIYELEGTNGTQLEELLVPEGKSRSIGYTVPDAEGTYDVKCYQPGGVSTIVKLVAGDGAQTGGPPGGSESPDNGGDGGGEPADDTVSVGLREYVVEPSATSVAAGYIEFTATNTSETDVHELAVLRVDDDGSLNVIGEIEDIDPGTGGTVTLELTTGSYQLACLIVPGEAGSAVDHYQEGMHTNFIVE